MKRLFHSLSAVTALLLAAIACQLPGPPAVTPTTDPGATPASPTAVTLPTSTVEAQAAPTQAAPTQAPPTQVVVQGVTEEVEPQCAILKTINFRRGPGTDFIPPLRAFRAGDIVIPTGFNPTGFPSGSWIQVLDPVANEIGWLILDREAVDCNIDVTTLPSVAVQAPPPVFPLVENRGSEGQPNGLNGEIITSSSYFLRMRVNDPYAGEDDGDGIIRVTFSVSNSSGEVYNRTENTAGYCIFGGGEPDCNPWTRVNGQFLWGEGGPPVEEGTYSVTIIAEPESAGGDESLFGQWFIQEMVIDLPY